MKKNKLHIAIIEDDDAIRSLLSENLRSADFTVTQFFTAEQFERKSETAYDLLLLDIMLPGKNGLVLLKEMRSKGIRLPVILITASELESHRDAAFDAGAIDYIVKPFTMRHLKQKIENLLSQFSSVVTVQNEAVIAAGRYDPALSHVTRGKISTALTPSEAKALEFLLANSNRIVSRGELNLLLNGDSAQASRNVDNYILKFRKLFEENPKKPEHFITIPRKGYALKR